jgi:hypothetical protein
MVTLRTDDTTPATMLTTPNDRPGNGKAQLRFQCSGDQWVLQEVVLDGMARILPEGRLEKAQAGVQPTCEERVVAAGTSHP